MRTKKVTFKNEHGVSLKGQIDFPVASASVYAIFAHCFTCSSSLKAVENISRALTAKNIAVLRFDFTGLGNSEGEFSESNFSGNISDLRNAYDFLSEEYEIPTLLIGHSLGGAAVLHVAGVLEGIQGVVTIGAPSSPNHVRKLLRSGEEDIFSDGEAEVNIGGRPFVIQKQFLDDLDKNDCTEIIGQIQRPLLIMHSPQDTIVSIENAAEIYGWARHPKSFMSLDGADHLLSDKNDSHYASNMIAAWAQKYIGATDNVESEGVVVDLDTSALTTSVSVGKHKFISDEPKSVGGDDLGPTPYDYLMAGLGACTAMTLRIYAKFKKIKLDHVHVVLNHEKIHAEDCESCEKGTTGKIDQIRRKISFVGELSDKERERLLQIADKCPVHKTLEGRPEILTEEIPN